MEVKALQQMLTQFRQIQENLQKQVEQISVEASAGGGMVTVRMNGQKQVTQVRVEPGVFAEKDPEMLQDLIVAAVNEAGRRTVTSLCVPACRGFGFGQRLVEILKRPGHVPRPRGSGDVPLTTG